eukprot:714301-Rhodomonas_salina.2
MTEASNAGLDVSKVKTIRPEEYPEMTKQLLEWINTVREKFNSDKDFGFGTSLEMIKTKAKQFAAKLEAGGDSKYGKFTASTGWALRWTVRYKVTSLKLVGEAGDVNPDDP